MCKVLLCRYLKQMIRLRGKEKTLVELKLTLIKSAFSPITKNTCCPHGKMCACVNMVNFQTKITLPHYCQIMFSKHSLFIRHQSGSADLLDNLPIINDLPLTLTFRI
jgi:hypothetical protein